MAPSTVKVLGISAEVFLLFRIDFNADSCVFNAVSVGFKIMIAAVSFTLFEDCSYEYF